MCRPCHHRGTELHSPPLRCQSAGRGRAGRVWWSRWRPTQGPTGTAGALAGAGVPTRLVGDDVTLAKSAPDPEDDETATTGGAGELLLRLDGFNGNLELLLELARVLTRWWRRGRSWGGHPLRTVTGSMPLSTLLQAIHVRIHAIQ